MAFSAETGNSKCYNFYKKDLGLRERIYRPKKKAAQRQL